MGQGDGLCVAQFRSSTARSVGQGCEASHAEVSQPAVAVELRWLLGGPNHILNLQLGSEWDDVLMPGSLLVFTRCHAVDITFGSTSQHSEHLPRQIELLFSCSEQESANYERSPSIECAWDEQARPNLNAHANITCLGGVWQYLVVDSVIWVRI